MIISIAKDINKTKEDTSSHKKQWSHEPSTSYIKLNKTITCIVRTKNNVNSTSVADDGRSGFSFVKL